MIYRLPALSLLLAFGCTPSATVPPEVDPAPPATSASATALPPPVDEEPPDKTTDDVRTMFVDAELVDCEGAGPMKCMRVRESEEGEWMLFYDRIEGFTHEAGKSYQLRVAVEKVTEPPADASSLRYRLVEVVSPKEAP